MADNTQNTPASSNPQVSSNTFSKGMLKDYNDTFIGEGLYTHARNAVNNSHDGQVGVIGNEPSNLSCVTLPYPVIGCIHLTDDQWLIFGTDDTHSSLGIFDESECSYAPLKNKLGQTINVDCLGLKRTHLITGAFRKRYDCERIVYWDDGLNPTRSMDVDSPVCIQSCSSPIAGCVTCVDTNVLDCEAIRLAPLVKHPCINIKAGKVAGSMPNGSYQACIAYTVNEMKVTDYMGLTAVQGLFSHNNLTGSLEINITEIDTSFAEFELVLLTNVNAQSVAKRIGYYNTSQGTIFVDRWDTEYVSVNVGDVVFRSEPIEKSDAMYVSNDYLLRVGTYSKFKFNYQPIANAIKSKWVAVQYPADYYIKSNNNCGYMRDEVYSFFIRWVYNTGEFSESYHIPGRAPLPSDTANIIGSDAFETYISPGTTQAIPRQTWQVENTGIIGGALPAVTTLSDGGVIIGIGDMAYWESTERYPDNRFDIWGSLCGKAIRHHKMPDETAWKGSAIKNPLSIFNNNGNSIVLLGVRFENIQPPVDLNNNPIPGIVGYEILRGSREGNKSIIGKGLFNNMRTFDPKNGTTGLFQNYPYNDLRTDPYLTARGFKKDIFSFHSPDTTFSNPYLNEGEVKLYQEFTGTSNGYFEAPWQHSNMKQLSNFVNSLATIFAIMNTLEAGQNLLSGILGSGGTTRSGETTITGTENAPVQFSYSAPAFPSSPPGSGNILQTIVSWTLYAFSVVAWAAQVYAVIQLTKALIDIKSQKILDLFSYLIPRRQYAVQYNSHGFYNGINTNIAGNRRRKVIESSYTANTIQNFGFTGIGTYTINNLNRTKAIILQLNRDIANTNNDSSRFTLGGGKLNTNFSASIASYYGALKIPIASQYGQLESIKQIPISTCITPYTQTTSEVLFGGDIYINRFTEKNVMPFFTSWLMGEPDEFEFNYQLYYNIPDPVYWINNQKFLYSMFSAGPGSYRSLDDETVSGALGGLGIGLFITKGWFYLFCNGVRDFFVESEVNVAYRDWEDDIPRRHYDKYRFADLTAMFRADIIRSGNYYKYDYNLSMSKLLNSHISWGNMLPRDYFPETYSTCYTYRPNRVIYSLPQQSGSKKDSWRAFLTNNYKDFLSRVSCIKPINKTGALFMMANQSPMSFMGLEELKVDGSGAKITIGDGGLFQQPMQSVVNVDESYEYASNQGKYCSVNTVHGVFWVSQNQGKVFSFANQIKEISASGGMRWWFAKYLPSELLKVYPSYALYDNPLVGVGVQMAYDNTYDILYITKTDYVPLSTSLTLSANNEQFLVNGVVVPFTDSKYFKKACFTVSFDCKSEAWISFHDWIPTFLIPGRNHFMTVNTNSIWKHNVRCDSYCNFYGVDYPFEIEFVSATGQTVNSMRSIEYLLEVYNMHNDCRDKFHVLDQNFDQAIIYNSEQISGILQLNLKTKNNPLDMLNYPRINNSPDYIAIQFSKEENKYRFNQFWDITNNRGEYTGVNIPMFNTEPNGYIYPINPSYVNYNKPILERKKFRHNSNRVFLRRIVSQNNKFLFKISNQKLLQSPR